MYPDIVNGEEGRYERVADRLAKGDIPQDEHVCSAVTMKCWQRAYESADEVIRDLQSLEAERHPGWVQDRQYAAPTYTIARKRTRKGLHRFIPVKKPH